MLGAFGFNNKLWLVILSEDIVCVENVCMLFLGFALCKILGERAAITFVLTLSKTLRCFDGLTANIVAVTNKKRVRKQMVDTVTFLAFMKDILGT